MRVCVCACVCVHTCTCVCRLAGGWTAADIDRRCFLPSPFCTITSQSMLATYSQAIWLLCDCQCLSQTSAGLPEGKGGSALCPHLCEGTGTDKTRDWESEGENEREVTEPKVMWSSISLNMDLTAHKTVSTHLWKLLFHTCFVGRVEQYPKKSIENIFKYESRF